MELWSKGLGRRVLSMALGERTATARSADTVVVDGVMHAPTYWEYNVMIDGEDVVDFLGVLEHPDAVRFVTRDPAFGRIVRIAAANAGRFLVNTVRAIPARDLDTDVTVPKQWGGRGYDPDDGDDDAALVSAGSTGSGSTGSGSAGSDDAGS